MKLELATWANILSPLQAVEPSQTVCSPPHPRPYGGDHKLVGKLKAFRKRSECGGPGTDSEGARLRPSWKILHKETNEPGISGEGVENGLENKEKL